MKKILCYILIAFIFLSSIFGKDTLPDIKNNDNMSFYLGMPIADVENLLGKPDRVSEELFTTEKPEFDEMFWEYDSGIRLSFFRGTKKIRRIFITSDKFFIEHDGIVLNIGKSTTQDVVDIWGTGSGHKYNNRLILEYTFAKTPIAHDIIAFHFSNNICIEIQIFDSSVFL